MPGSVTLTGRLYDEATLIAVARAFQQATGDHRESHPWRLISPRNRNGKNRRNRNRRKLRAEEFRNNGNKAMAEISTGH